MKVAFKDDSFAFEFVRNLGFMYYGGCDLGEMIATTELIEEGNFESWFSHNARMQATLPVCGSVSFLCAGLGVVANTAA